MATATNSENRTASDNASVFASPEMLNQVLDEVFAELPTHAEPEPSSRLAADSPRPKEVPARRNTYVAYQPRPRSRVAGWQDEEPDWFYRSKRTLWIGLMILGAVMFYRGMPSSWRTAINPFADTPSSAGSVHATSASSSEKRLVTKPIEDVRLGDRLVGRNPIREQAEGVEPDPATWRELSLYMQKESGLGLWIDLLRPLEWIDEHNAQRGSTIYIELPEMGAVGDAEVTYLGPCPEIKPGKGTVVTGTFKHQADENSNVVHLKLEGQVELTGVTDNHAYWSVDRQDFVEVGNLRIGELVDTEFGLRKVVSATPIEYTGFLYNLETTEHVYRVGSLGTLVHNSCVDRAAASAQRHGGQALETANHFRYPSRQAARQAASEIAGNMGRETRAIRLNDFRGAPPQMSASNRVIGRQSADGSIGWRDDFLGHPRFGAGPHVNVWVDRIEFHLWY
jgi:hypothetical protein